MRKRKSPTCFVLDENKVYREIIPSCLDTTIPGSLIKTFSSPEEMLPELELKPDLLVSEYEFSGNSYNGKILLDLIHEKSPHTSVIFITANHSIQTAVKVIRSGALDYIPKSTSVFDALIRKLIVFRENMDFIHRSDQQIKRLYILLVIILMILTGSIFYYNYIQSM